MLALIAAVTLGIVLVLLFFALNYTRLLGGVSEQKSAIEAASLAAAQDLSRIVVQTQSMGYVSLSDYAPVVPSSGGVNMATDGLPVRVHGLNSLLGTARADALIASSLNNSVMASLVNYDLHCITQEVLPTLNNAFADAIKPSPRKTYYDVNRTQVTVYADALAAYQSNSIRMTGKTTYVPNSLALQMGYTSQPTITNIKVPLNHAPASGQYSNGNYYSFVQVPVTQAVSGGPGDFMFAGIGSTVSLIDYKLFVPVPSATVAGTTSYVKFTPAMMPTIVSASAQQSYSNNQNPDAKNITAQACAQPAGNVLSNYTPGALTIGMPDGPVTSASGSTITSLHSILTDPQLNAAEAYAKTAVGGDYSNGDSTHGGGSASLSSNYSAAPTWMTGSNVYSPANIATSPGVNNPPTMQDCCALAVYDWFRQAGPLVDIDSVVSMAGASTSATYTVAPNLHDWIVTNTAGRPQNITQGSTGHPQISAGVQYLYKFSQNNGNFTAKFTSESPYPPMPYMSLAENQFFAYSNSCLGTSNAAVKTWDHVAGLNIPTGHHSALQRVVGWLASLLGLSSSSTSAPDGMIKLMPIWDVAIRSQARNFGTGQTGAVGGQHGGEPQPNKDSGVTQVSSNHASSLRTAFANETSANSDGHVEGFASGIEAGARGIGAGHNHQQQDLGAHPIIGTQSDFDDAIPTASGTEFQAQWPYYIMYNQYFRPYNRNAVAPATGTVRPTYTTTGSVCQIRFRQQLKASNSYTGTGTTTSTVTTTAGTVTSSTVSSTSATDQSLGYFEEEN